MIKDKRVNLNSCNNFVCLRCSQYISFKYKISSMKLAEPLPTIIFEMKKMVQNLFTLHCAGDLPWNCIIILIRKSNLFLAVHQCNFECFMLKGWWVHHLLFLICQIHKMKNGKRRNEYFFVLLKHQTQSSHQRSIITGSIEKSTADTLLSI